MSLTQFNLLEKAFMKRKCLKKYEPLTLELKNYLKKLFETVLYF